MPQEPQSPSFEQDLQELEELVSLMERGELSLEDSLGHFERGITLTRRCQKALRDAEQKVEILLEQNGQSRLEAFGRED